MDIFYIDHLENDIVVMDQGESYHCIKVLRNTVGAEIHFTDGNGSFGTGEIAEASPKACKIRVTRIENHDYPEPYKLNIAIAPTKNRDRFEWFIEKATEIGIWSVTPVICERSERKSIRTDRLENIVRSAIKQSGRFYKPTINETMRLADWIDKAGTGARYIAHCMEEERMDIQALESNANYQLLIGPEGDFTPDEVRYALDNQFMPLSLGKHRLRTETAGIFACAAFNMINPTAR